MTAARRRITIVAGVGAFIVLAVVALNWREVYYWIAPEARLWGTWEVVDPVDASAEWISFRRQGDVVHKLSTLFTALPVTARRGRCRVPSYRVIHDRVVLAAELTALGDRRIAIQFSTDNANRLEFIAPLSLMLRRLPETGFADE